MKLSRSKAPTLVAVNVTASWLRSFGEHVVVAQNHKSFFCRDKQVCFYDDTPEEGKFNARALASADFDTAADSFSEICTSLGLGPLRPTLRPAPTPDQDALLRALRSNEYRFAPDLDATQLQKYAPVISSVVGSFCYGNRYRLEACGVRKEDLLLASRMWAASFDLRYRREHDVDATRKFFGNYLKQRLVHFSQMSLEQPHLVMTESGVELSPEEDLGPSVDEVSVDLASRAAAELPSVLEARIGLFLQKDPTLPKDTGRRLAERIAWLRRKPDLSGDDYLFALSAPLLDLRRHA